MADIVRILCTAEIRRFAGRTHGKLIHICLAEQDGILRFQDLPDRCVIDRHIVFQYFRAAGRADIFGRNVILEGHRDAFEQRDLFSCGDLFIY